MILFFINPQILGANNINKYIYYYLILLRY